MTPKPESYGKNHYAVYPRTLISPLLQATAPTRVCPVCGAPWCPVVERENPSRTLNRGRQGYGVDEIKAEPSKGTSSAGHVESNVAGYRPTCEHVWKDPESYGGPNDAGQFPEPDRPLDPIPGWCLDPFAGTFTTGEVCAELGVNAVGLDISPQYLDEHAKPRIGQTPSGALDELPLFEGM